MAWASLSHWATAWCLAGPASRKMTALGLIRPLRLGDETSGAGGVIGSPALQATRTRAAGSTQSPFTQPVFLVANSVSPVLVKPSIMRPEVRSALLKVWPRLVVKPSVA